MLLFFEGSPCLAIKENGGVAYYPLTKDGKRVITKHNGYKTIEQYLPVLNTAKMRERSKKAA